MRLRSREKAMTMVRKPKCTRLVKVEFDEEAQHSNFPSVAISESVLGSGRWHSKPCMESVCYQSTKVDWQKQRNLLGVPPRTESLAVHSDDGVLFF
jgi:hypothetical protein